MRLYPPFLANSKAQLVNSEFTRRPCSPLTRFVENRLNPEMRISVWFLVLASAIHCSNLSAKEIPLEILFAPPNFSGVRISPDGRFMTYRIPHKDRMDAAVYDTLGESSRRFKGELSQDVGTIRWASA